MRRDYQKRSPKEYNIFRNIFQWITCTPVYGLYYKIAFGLTVEGRQNVPKNKMCIIASNHLSAIDPFLIIYAVQRPVAYMAKTELFDKPIMRFFLDLLGAFAVDRSKLSPSTIKTVYSLKETNWCMGIFPQGTRERDGNMENINKGFAIFAQKLKCDILPVALIGTANHDRKLFKSKMKIKIGKPFKYSDDIDGTIETWKDSISQLLKGENNG